MFRNLFLPLLTCTKTFLYVGKSCDIPTIRDRMLISNVKPCNFVDGDLFLVATRKIQTRGNKFRIQWLVSKFRAHIKVLGIYQCQDLINNGHSVVHGDRLKKHTEGKLDVSEEFINATNHNGIH